MVEIDAILNAIGELPGFTGIIKIFQAVGIVIVIYFIFLIIRGILQYRYVKKISSISKNLEEINKKMDLFLEKASKIKNKK